MLHIEHSCRGIEHVQRANRLKTIANAVRVPGGARVGDLARATGTSPMTIRRDLAELERQGVLRRTHGGAVSLPTRGSRLPFAVRLGGHLEQKQSIAAATVELIPDGSSVIVDAGTTCSAVAHALAGRDITALALSVPVAAALGERPGARIVTPGGQLDSDELAWSGHRAVREVIDFRADVAVLGVCAWDEAGGLTASSLHDAEVKKALLGSARRTIAVTTPEAIGTSATFTVCPTGQVDTLVTTPLPQEMRAWITVAGVEILEVESPGPSRPGEE